MEARCWDVLVPQNQSESNAPQEALALPCLVGESCGPPNSLHSRPLLLDELGGQDVFDHNYRGFQHVATI